MSDFPDNFDFIIYGTGVVESILSAALSTTGNKVLHIDKNDYYGGYSGCLRIVELEKIIEKWQNSQISDNSDDLYVKSENYVKFVSCDWHVGSGNAEANVKENGSHNLDCTIITEQSLRQSMRGFEFELFPRLMFSESQTIDALIQSDVTRYLEFKFITKLVSLFENKIIPIPINRSDIVKTRVFSLRQKRQLTSFLEWCFTLNVDDELILKYAGQPLVELIRAEKNIDSFTEKIIIECMALSHQNVETREGITKIKRLLYSFNKYGSYPIMWPNYGCGEIPQAFCRMSAVFGSVYSLNTCVVSCSGQLSVNGVHRASLEQQDDIIPTTNRKLKLRLSNDSDVYADKIIAHKSYVNPCYISNIDDIRWVSRAILVTNKSLINENREPSDILMFPFHVNAIDKLGLLLEFPTDNFRNIDKQDLYIVHLTLFTESLFDSREILRDHINEIFDKYNVSPQSLKPQILFECYFTLPDFSSISVELNNNDVIDRHSYFVNSSLIDIEFEDCMKEAKNMFTSLLPGVEFLPRPPNPEDIIQLGEDAVPSTNQISGDFPFTNNFIQSSPDTLNAPGDGPSSTNYDEMHPLDLEVTTISNLMEEIELHATISEIDSARQ